MQMQPQGEEKKRNKLLSQFLDLYIVTKVHRNFVRGGGSEVHEGRSCTGGRCVRVFKREAVLGVVFKNSLKIQ